MKNCWLLLAFAIILNACNVQKRKYRDGFYVNWHHKKSTKTTSQLREEPDAKPVITQNYSSTAQNMVSESSYASVSTQIQPLEKKRVSFTRAPGDSCDLIIFRDGTELKSKVREITGTDIKYRRCEMPDGPDYVVSKATVFMIKFSNGTREVMPAPTQQPNTYNQSPAQQPYKGKKVLNDYALFSLIFGIIGLVNPFGLGILGIVLGNKAIRQIEQYPDRYKGKVLAQIGRTLGYIKLGFYVGILVLIVLSLILL